MRATTSAASAPEQRTLLPLASAYRHVGRARGLDRLLGPDQYVERSGPANWGAPVRRGQQLAG
jgi:hypothetical protein